MRFRTILALIVCTLLGGLAVVPSAQADEPGVTIDGPVRAGRPIRATVSGINGSKSFEWSVDGVEVPALNLIGQPMPEGSLIVLEEFIGKEITVAVVVTPEGGGAPVRLVSAPHLAEPGKIVANPVKLVEGEFLIGRPITVAPQVLYPLEGVTNIYQWRNSQGPIPGATAATYTPDASVEYTWISVEVTSSKPGWEPATTTYSASRHVRYPMSATGAVLSGEAKVGGTVFLDLTGADGVDSPARMRVEWFLDGRKVPDEVSYVLKLQPGSAGKSLYARAMIGDGRSDDATFTSNALTIKETHLVEGDDEIKGPAVVGWLARVHPRSYDHPATHKVTWLRDGVPIPGAAGLTYRYTAADINRSISARVEVLGDGWRVNYNLAAMRKVAFNVYTTPGEHDVNGRQWRTSCEPYSATIRCRTEIRATQIVKVNGRWATRTGHVFNNLTYVPLATGNWGANPLANAGQWTDAAGRQWRTECNTPATGRGACRTYIFIDVTRQENGRYRTERQWVFNNVVNL